MKEKRIEKEIKKAQKKGIYNPKLRLGIVALILVIGTVIGVSYAYYTDKSTTVLTISGTVSKKIKVTVNATNGTVNSSPQIVDYGTQATFTVSPNEGYQYKEVTCKEDNDGRDVTSIDNATYTSSNNTLTVTPKTSQNITCTVTFKEKARTLQEIVNDIKNKAKGTLTSTDFYNGCPLSDNDTCSGVYKMDDYSNSTSLNYNNPGGTSYYFRGAVENNYVQFGKGKTSDNSTQHDLLWRIVRINGDGSIRLILDGNIGTSMFNTNYNSGKYTGYTYENITPCTNSNPCQSYAIATNNEESIGTTDHGGTNSTIKKKLEAWYYDNLRNYDDKVAYGIYCNDTSYGSEADYWLKYGTNMRLYNSNPKPQLTCPDPKADDNETDSVITVGNITYHTYGGVYKLKIGLLSADEIVIAGFKPSGSGVTTSNYLYYGNISNNYFWSSSPESSRPFLNADFFFANLGASSLYGNGVDSDYQTRPVINLSTSTKISKGDGTKSNPYIVS